MITRMVRGTLGIGSFLSRAVRKIEWHTRGNRNSKMRSAHDCVIFFCGDFLCVLTVFGLSRRWVANWS